MNCANPKQPIFAIIGCGLIGRKRLLAFGANPPVRYVCDLDHARAVCLSAIATGSQPITDFSLAIADRDVGAIIISTLNASLAPITLAAVEAGKDVLVEKPGGISAFQLREISAVAARSGSRVRFGYNHRFHPAIRRAHELVTSGVLGPLMFLRGRYGHGGRKGYDREWRANHALSGGGELIDQGVHLIDLAGWFLGDLPHVSGHAATYFWDMKVDDNAFLSLRTAEGKTAWLHVSCTEWKNLFSLEIYGRDGKIAIDGLGGSYGIERLTYYKMLPQMGPPETSVTEYPANDDSWRLELEAFLADISGNRTPVPGLREGIRTLEIVESVYRQSGYPVSTAGILQ